MNYHGIRVGRLDPLDDRRKYWSARAHHALGWVHDALNGVLHIRRRKGGAIVPLHALVQMKGNRFATVADFPGICQLGDNIQSHGIIRAGTDQAVIGRGDRCINTSERGLMRIIEGDLFVANVMQAGQEGSMVPNDSSPDATIRQAAQLILAAAYVTALTGAGISVESGIPPFRGPGGLWTKYGEPPMDGYQRFLQDPKKAWE